MQVCGLFHSGPVTALYCHQGYVLAGVGAELHVYDVKTSSQTNLVEVLTGCNIHGILAETDQPASRLCVYGQKCLRLLEFDSSVPEIKVLSGLLEFKDWIWDIVWLQDAGEICLAMGHNEVAFLNIDQMQVTKLVKSQEKCILYSAKFLSSNQDCIVLAAGTVFNHVVMWSPSDTPNTNGCVDSLHTLTGHQGVIFSVDYDVRSGHVCSASDDRSIRLYQLQFPSNSTGAQLSDWHGLSSSLLHVVYGHSARVWDVRLLSNVFVSVGEDATCCIWSYEGHVIKKFKGHKGKSIWSLAVDRGENYVVTGGGDHSVRLWKLHDEQLDRKDVDYEEEEAEGYQSSILDLMISPEDFPRNTQMCGQHKVLVMTNLGKLLLYNLVNQQVRCLFEDHTFTSYTVMAVSEHRGMVAIGNILGILRVLQIEGCESSDMKIKDTSVCKGKLLSVVWLDKSSILTTGFGGIVTVWHLSEGNLEMSYVLELPASRHRWVTTATVSNDGSYLICGDRTGSVYQYKLDQETQSGQIQTCFPKLHGKGGVTDVCFHGNHVYSAGRDGLYRQFLVDEDSDSLSVLNSSRVCKGFEWLEQINFTEDGDVLIQGFHTNMFVLWSVGCNQKLLEINCGGGHRTWDFCLHGNQAVFVWVKARQVMASTVSLKSQQVILKNCLHGRELCAAKFICPPFRSKGQRSYVMVTCSEDTSLCLTLLHYANQMPTLSVLHTLSGHISSVRCLATTASSKISKNASEHKKLMFSCGGRAQIRVWRVTVSGVDSNVSRSSNNCVLASGQLEMCDNQYKSGLKDESTCDKILEAEDIACTYECLTGVLLNEIGKRRKKPWRFPQQVYDPETRILDVAVERASKLGDEFPGDLFLVSTACSDGFVRIFTYEENSDDLTLLYASDFHNHCLLKTEVCIVQTENHVTINSEVACHVTSKNRNRLVIITAATDGIVAFWDLTDVFRKYVNQSGIKNQSSYGTGTTNSLIEAADLEPFFTLPLHQSGINGLCLYTISGSKYMLATGGDDNALHVVTVTMTTDNSGNLVSDVTARGSSIHAHAAQITGVWILNEQCVITASIDQRLIVWSIREMNAQLEVVPTIIKFVNVSDVSSLHVNSDSDGHTLLLAGLGIEVLRLDKEKNECRDSNVARQHISSKLGDTAPSMTHLVL